MVAIARELAGMAGPDGTVKLDALSADEQAKAKTQALLRGLGQGLGDVLAQALSKWADKVDLKFTVGDQKPSGETIVCRCEETTARQIIDTVALGCPGPNQMKIFLRCGMGPCQGRLCGLTVTELIAESRGVPPPEVGYYRLRPPVKPITVGEVAALPKTDAAVYAVTRM